MASVVADVIVRSAVRTIAALAVLLIKKAFAVLRRELGGRGLFGMFFRKQVQDA